MDSLGNQLPGRKTSRNGKKAAEERFGTSEGQTMRPKGPRTYVVVSLIGGPQYRPQNIIVLNVGTLKMVPLILGNYHVGFALWGLGILV